MSTATAAPRRLAPSVGAPRLTFAHLVRAEWTALWSLRGTIVSLVVGGVIAIASAVGFAILWGSAAGDEAASAGGVLPIGGVALGGVVIAQIVAVLIGVASYAKELSTGALRTQLAAAPRRSATLGAKAVVVAVTSFAWSAVVLLLSFAGVAIAYAAFDFPVALDAVDVIVPVLGGAALVALSAVLGLGVAALLRSETWAVSLVIVFLLILPGIVASLPFDGAPQIAQLLMGQTGDALYTVHEQVTGEVVRDIALTFAWPAAALVAGMAVMSRRDA